MAALSGWFAAALAAAGCLFAWRSFSIRMEGVMRACHEIRGPLTAVRLGLEAGGRGAPLSADRVRAIDLELCKAALALEDLAGDRAASARPSRSTEIDLAELVSDSVEAWRSVAERGGSALSLVNRAERVAIVADRFRIAQALANLLANAIEHGGDQVRVEVRRESGQARVEVQDDGPGLPAPLGHLVRGRDRARRRAGRGRGLAIASAIAEAHQGRVYAASAERGTRMILELPSRAPAARAHLTAA